jgi:hypothetical protein
MRIRADKYKPLSVLLLKFRYIALRVANTFNAPALAFAT